MIRMKNKEGTGFADAYSEQEAESYIAKGWSKVVPKAEPEPEPGVQEVAEPEAPKKRGRPAKAN